MSALPRRRPVGEIQVQGGMTQSILHCDSQDCTVARLDITFDLLRALTQQVSDAARWWIIVVAIITNISCTCVQYSQPCFENVQIYFS